MPVPAGPGWDCVPLEWSLFVKLSPLSFLPDRGEQPERRPLPAFRRTRQLFPAGLLHWNFAAWSLKLSVRRRFFEKKSARPAPRRPVLFRLAAGLSVLGMFCPSL